MIEPSRYHAGEDLGRIRFKLAQGAFDADIPDRSGARICLLESRRCEPTLREFGWRGQYPKERAYNSTESLTSFERRQIRPSSKGALKSSGTLILPFSSPRCFLRTGSQRGSLHGRCAAWAWNQPRPVPFVHQPGQMSLCLVNVYGGHESYLVKLNLV